MKLFRVIFDVDLEFNKETKSTPIRREQRYYAASKIERVWDAIATDRADEVMNLIAIVEESPSCQVLLDQVPEDGE